MHHIVCTWSDAENHQSTSGVWLPLGTTWETALVAAEAYADDVADTNALKLERCEVIRVFRNTDPLVEADSLCNLERAGCFIFELKTPVLAGREPLRSSVVIPGIDPLCIDSTDKFSLNLKKAKIIELLTFLTSTHHGLQFGDVVAGSEFKRLTADYWQWRDLLTYAPSWWKTKRLDWFM